MSKFDPTEYKISIQRQAVDSHMYYVGTVLELPDVEVYEDSFEQAYSALVCIIESLKEAADSQGRTFPSPSIQATECSGRVTLRMPKSIHYRCVEMASNEDVSLNQYLLSIISEAIGERTQKARVPIIIAQILHQESGLSTAKWADANKNFLLFTQNKLTPTLAAT